MLSQKLIYLYLNGEAEGFLGIGSTLGQAHEDAVKKIKHKLKTNGETFDVRRIQKDLNGLAPEERKKVLEDFKKYM